MLLINTGDGKGKTTAAVGQALRTHGRDLRVSFCQFLKKDKQAGEQAMLHQLLGEEFYPGGAGFFVDKREYQKHRSAAASTLNWALERLDREEPPFLLVCDELLYALRAKLITDAEVKALVHLARERETHLLLTGRGLPDWLANQADLVTEMTLVKHPFERGMDAQEGIEY